MLYALFLEFSEKFSALNVFQYLTFRSICAVLTSLVVSLALGPYMIRKLQIKQIDQTIREDGPPTHFDKVGTPTMGGLLILAAVIASTLLWSDLSNRYVWVAIFVFAAFGLVGFWDDYKKLIDKNPRGMGSRNKILGQSFRSKHSGSYRCILVVYHSTKRHRNNLNYSILQRCCYTSGRLVFDNNLFSDSWLK